MSEQNLKLGAPGAIIIGAVIVAAAIVYTNRDVNPTVQPDQQDNQVAEATIDNDAILGDKDAPVTIIEFSDYQCPFCRSFWTETFPLIKENYVDTGKVRMVYRDFPLSSHPMAVPFAEAAECAGDQDKYWEMHDLIFEEQNKHEQGTVTNITADDLPDLASQLGLDLGKFNECMDSDKHLEEIAKDLEDGSNAGVTGTPSFFINGKSVRGAVPFDSFKQVIEEELGA